MRGVPLVFLARRLPHIRRRQLGSTYRKIVERAHREHGQVWNFTIRLLVAQIVRSNVNLSIDASKTDRVIHTFQRQLVGLVSTEKVDKQILDALIQVIAFPLVAHKKKQGLGSHSFLVTCKLQHRFLRINTKLHHIQHMSIEEAALIVSVHRTLVRQGDILTRLQLTKTRLFGLFLVCETRENKEHLFFPPRNSNELTSSNGRISLLRVNALLLGLVNMVKSRRTSFIT